MRSIHPRRPAGTVLCTLIGAAIVTVINNGCTKLGLQNWVQEIVTGVTGLTTTTRATPQGNTGNPLMPAGGRGFGGGRGR